LTFHGLIFCHSKANSLSHLHILLSALTDAFSFRSIQSLWSKSLVRNFVKNVMNNMHSYSDANNNRNDNTEVQMKTVGSWSQRMLWWWQEDENLGRGLTPPHPTATHLSKQVSTRLLYNLCHGKWAESSCNGSSGWYNVNSSCKKIGAILTTHLRESLICVSSKCLMNSAFWWSGTFVNASMLLILKRDYVLNGGIQFGYRDSSEWDRRMIIGEPDYDSLHCCIMRLLLRETTLT
jgi:hypothetical protein